MKTKYFILGVLAGIITGLLIGYHMGSRWTQKLTDQLRAEIRASNSGIDEKKNINMASALEQVRKEAQRRGIELTDVSACDACTVRLRIANGPEVSLQWRDMGEDTAACWRDLDRRFGNLIAVVNKANEAKAPVNHVDMVK